MAAGDQAAVGRERNLSVDLDDFRATQIRLKPTATEPAGSTAPSAAPPPIRRTRGAIGNALA